MKNNLASHSCHDSIVVTFIDINAFSTSSSKIENDICMLKNNVDCLGSTLSQCAMDHKKLEPMFRKKQGSHIHVHQSRYAHAQTHTQTHTHDSIYTHVYTCTHCGRKSHLAKFCYDRIHD